MRYKIVEAGSREELMRKVNELLQDEWELQGSVTNNNFTYTQALTKTAKTELDKALETWEYIRSGKR